jgi:hypothetical protein
MVSATNFRDTSSSASFVDQLLARRPPPQVMCLDRLVRDIEEMVDLSLACQREGRPQELAIELRSLGHKPGAKLP